MPLQQINSEIRIRNPLSVPHRGYLHCYSKRGMAGTKKAFAYVVPYHYIAFGVQAVFYVALSIIGFQYAS